MLITHILANRVCSVCVSIMYCFDLRRFNQRYQANASKRKGLAIVIDILTS